MDWLGGCGAPLPIQPEARPGARPGARPEATPEATGVRKVVVDVKDLVGQLRALVEGARSMPMSSSAVLNRGEVLDLVGRIEAALPTAFADQDRVYAERESLISQARDESQQMLKEAEAERDRLVGETEVYRVAKHEAARVRGERGERGRGAAPRDRQLHRHPAGDVRDLAHEDARGGLARPRPAAGPLASGLARRRGPPGRRSRGSRTVRDRSRCASRTSSGRASRSRATDSSRSARFVEVAASRYAESPRA